MSKLSKGYKEHLKGWTAESCLVCGLRPLVGTWTDYNGQIRCELCGTTYQTLGSHLNDKTLEENHIKKEDIVQRYCDVFELVPVLSDYYAKTKRKVPFGTYIMNNPIPKDDYDDFYRWLAKNADKYQEEYKDYFRWDKILGSQSNIEEV